MSRIRFSSWIFIIQEAHGKEGGGREKGKNLNNMKNVHEWESNETGKQSDYFGKY